MSSDEELDWSEPETRARRFRVTNLARMAQSLEQLVASLSRELEIPRPLAQVLLYRHKFNFDRCVETYFDHLESLNLPDFNNVLLCSGALQECLLCCEESVTGANAGCGHSVCRECFFQYVKLQIEERNVEIRCPGNSNCNYILTDDIIQTVVNGHLWRQYVKAKVDSWLPVAKRIFTGCPTPNCKYFVELLEPIDTSECHPGIALQKAVVECGCAARFCFLCSQSHLPVSCEMVEVWIRVSNDASNLWIREHTKQCPSCGASIQKNDGCDHMLCRCGHHFCWACLGNFYNYSHRCATYDAKHETFSQSKSAVAAARLLHYAPRVISNLARVKFHFTHLTDLLDQNCDDDEDPLNEFGPIQSQDPRIEVHTALAYGRSLLGWTFVLLYYIKNSNERLMLEDCVLNLQDASENLGKEITAKEVKISTREQLQRAAYVRSRTSTLLTFVMAKKWEFESYAQF